MSPNDYRAEGFDVALKAISISLSELSRKQFSSGLTTLAYITSDYANVFGNIKNPYRSKK